MTFLRILWFMVRSRCAFTYYFSLFSSYLSQGFCYWIVCRVVSLTDPWVKKGKNCWDEEQNRMGRYIFPFLNSRGRKSARLASRPFLIPFFFSLSAMFSNHSSFHSFSFLTLTESATSRKGVTFYMWLHTICTLFADSQCLSIPSFLFSIH